MILASLTQYYDQLLERGKIESPGWCKARVMATLVISETGELLNIVVSGEKRGTEIVVPERVKRAVNVAANLLCDPASYLLGVGDKPERDAKCFEASKELHHLVLDGTGSVCATAILSFYDQWDVAAALENDLIREHLDALKSGNACFAVRTNAGLRESWKDAGIVGACTEYLTGADTDAVLKTCLVTGEKAPTVRLHPAIKGVMGAQSSGASLVSFNAPAFESYGFGQGDNAAVSTKAARAYGVALNYLLSAPEHCVRMGDTTVVFWSENCDEGNSGLFSLLFGGMSAKQEMSTDDRDAELNLIMKSLARGEAPAMGVDPETRFNVLGLAPNAARLSVRLFLQDEFGSMLGRVREHYERLAVSGSSYSRLTPYWLLRAMENEN